MATSARFVDLRQRLTALRKHMLPATFSPTGSYTERQIDRTKGYRLLVHAEIEAYLEDITMDAAKTAFIEWSNTKKAADLLFCLMASYHHGFEIDDEGPLFPKESRHKIKEAVKDVVQVAFLQYKKVHDDNNGLKEKNLVRLVVPIGVRIDELDPTWIVNLNEFGKRRGDIAHKSIKAHQAIDPSSELNDVNNLIVGLEALDGIIAGLRV